MRILAGVLAALIALGVWHEMSVFSTRDNPPVSCQLLGGEWSPLTGWHCGAAPAAPASSPAGNTGGDSFSCDDPQYSRTCACGACPGGGGARLPDPGGG